MDLIERLQDNAHRHPWEISRADSILRLIPFDFQGLRCADIGSGDQYFAGRLARLTQVPVYAVDAQYASDQDQTTIYQRRHLQSIPKKGLDVVFLMDVLEHVESDRALLADAAGCLRPGGTAIITVPAHPVLFSNHDVLLRHHRRYTAAALKTLIRSCGLTLQEFFFFYAPLLVIRGLERIIRQNPKAKGVGAWRRPPEDVLTWGLKSLLNLDFRINRRLARYRLPSVGLSLCAITRTTSA